MKSEKLFSDDSYRSCRVDVGVHQDGIGGKESRSVREGSKGLDYIK